jgi:hypothetical protein
VANARAHSYGGAQSGCEPDRPGRTDLTRGPQRFAWLLSLGLTVAGALAAHGLAYRFAEPHAERREHLLEETGHGYLHTTQLASLCVALVVVGFAGAMLAEARRAERPPLWAFALAPPIGFALQEHCERILASDVGGLHTILEPTFLFGLLLQFPFALVALLVARALLAAAGALARRLGTLPRAKLAHDAACLALPAACWIPAAPTLVGARGQRAPPLPSAASR